MNPLLAKAAGYDFANLWMNLAKVLIIFMFIYQQALSTQLGVNMFKRIYYVFHLRADSTVPSQGSANSGGPPNHVATDQRTVGGPSTEDAEVSPSVQGAFTQVITQVNPLFSIGFLPLAISTRYDIVRVEILEVKKILEFKSRRGEVLKLNPSNAYKEYDWPSNFETQEASLRVAVFNLRQVVKPGQPLSSGDYDVRFAFRFFRRGRTTPIHQEGVDREEAHNHTMTVKYFQPSEPRFGGFPVVHGQWFAIPEDLLGRQFTPTEWRSRKTQSNESAWSDWITGTVVRNSNERFYPQGVSPGRTYEQRCFYDEGQNRIHFTVIFMVSENKPPRSTYSGPGERDIYFVKLFTKYYFDGPGYQYFNLSRYIIDPDGRNMAGQADVRVRRIDSLHQESNHYSLEVAEDGSGDFRLKVNGNLERILPQTGDSEDVAVTARDEANNQTIKIRIERKDN